MTNSDTIEAPLSETRGEYWVNTILYRLARALGYEPDETGAYTLDPDELLNEAVSSIERGQDDELHYCG